MNIIPKFAGGLDIETKGTNPDCQILSISVALFEVATMKLAGQFNEFCSPTDETQNKRSYDERTLDWWANPAQDPTKPSEECRRITWGGRKTLFDVLGELDNWLRSFGVTFDQLVLSCKGPDFDFVVIDNALKTFNIRHFRLYARQMDSTRTIERFQTILKMPPVSMELLDKLSPYGKHIPHVSICDANLEGWEAARMFNVLGKITSEIEIADYMPEEVF